MIAAPYFSVERPTPSWARLIAGDNNRIVHEIDARGSGLIGGITPQVLIPHGETVSVLSSAMVQSDATSTANGFEGIGHSLQGFVRGPTGSPVKVFDNNILTNGDPSQWINDTYADSRRVTFIDQMPENISPEWMKSVWFTKTITGQTRFSNLEFRDHYSRRYKSAVGATSWDENNFSLQTNQAMIVGRDVIALNNFIETVITDIRKGQNISLEMSTFIESASAFNVGSIRLPITIGLALKLTRVSGGGADWWATAVSSTPDDRDLTDTLVERSESFVAQNSYNQIELVMWVIHTNGSATDIGPLFIDHSGINMNININDSLETG